MEGNINLAGEIQVIDHKNMSLIHQFVEHKISEPYNADEVKAHMAVEMTNNEIKGGYLNIAHENSFAVDLSHQYKEIPSENLSWFDYILFTIAGIVMGIMIFGALL